MTLSVDVLVAGAGPAGSITAGLLARAGLKVVIADRPPGNALKIGETLPGAALRLLRKIDYPIPDHAGPHRPIPGVTSCWGNGVTRDDFLTHPDGPSWRLDRLTFDAALLIRAQADGAVPLGGWCVAIERDHDRWKVVVDPSTELHARWLVDATGRRTWIARRLGSIRRVGPPLIATWSLETTVAQSRENTHRTLIEACSDGWWYGAALPGDRMLAIFHTEPDLAHSLVQDLDSWRAALKKSTLLNNYTNGAAFDRVDAVDARSAWSDPPHGINWVAVGDAALSFDPLASQGIFNAIAGAEMVSTALQAPAPEDALTAYADRLDSIRTIYQGRRQSFYRIGHERFQTAFWAMQQED